MAVEAGSLPPLGPGPVRKTLILQVSLAWRQLTVHFRETSVCVCVWPFRPTGLGKGTPAWGWPVGGPPIGPLLAFGQLVRKEEGDDDILMSPSSFPREAALCAAGQAEPA